MHRVVGAGAGGPQGKPQAAAESSVSTGTAHLSCRAGRCSEKQPGRKSGQAGAGGGLLRATAPVTEAGSTCLTKHREQVSFLFSYFSKYSTSLLHQ